MNLVHTTKTTIGHNMKPLEKIIRTELDLKAKFEPKTPQEREMSHCLKLWQYMKLKDRRELFGAVKHYMVFNTQKTMMNILRSENASCIKYGENLCLKKGEYDTWDNVRELYFGGYRDTYHKGLWGVWVVLFQSMATRYGYNLTDKQSKYNWLTDWQDDLTKPIEMLA